MNPLYNRKLQSALIAAGKKVEMKLKEPAPSPEEIERLHQEFQESLIKADPLGSVRASTELIAALLKYQIEKL